MSALVAYRLMAIFRSFRLGLFGFAAGPQLRESGEEGVGNFGGSFISYVF